MFVMTTIKMPRARRKSLWVFVAAMGVLVSCGRAEKFELTLRVRDDGSSPTCVERHWMAADGRHATSAECSGTLRVAAPIEFGDAECGGRTWQRHYFSVLGPEPASRDDSFELKVDDGNRLMLDPQTEVIVDGGAGTAIECVEQTGRWQGTAGDLQNHEGTFTIHYDSIQTILRLVED